VEIEFFRPRFVGKRFDGGAIPLEVLKDLAVLEEMFLEVGKWCYLREHRTLSRSARGLTEGFELKLSGVEVGSAYPVIILVMSLMPPSFLSPEPPVHLVQAREAVVSAVEAAENNRSPLEHLPEKYLAYFDRLGRSLLDGEGLEFRPTNQENPARLTRESRRRLLADATTVREVTEQVRLRAAIPEVDQHKMTCQLLFADGRRVVAPLPEMHLEIILQAFNGYRQGVRVLIEGIGLFSKQPKLLRLESVGHVSILDPRDIPSRLAELRGLQEGWFDGRGREIADAGLNWLSSEFERQFPDDLPLPFLYPTPDGGIRAEWSLKPHEISLEIDLSTRQADWHRLNLDSDDSDESTIDLSSDSGWEDLAKRLRNSGAQ
jgi:hypothetical protein